MGSSDFSLMRTESDSGCLPLSCCLGNTDPGPSRDLDLTDGGLHSFASYLLCCCCPCICVFGLWVFLLRWWVLTSNMLRFRPLGFYWLNQASLQNGQSGSRLVWNQAPYVTRQGQKTVTLFPGPARDLNSDSYNLLVWIIQFLLE